MTLTISFFWWYIPLVLFIIPVIYSFFRKPEGQYDFMIDVMILFAACWVSVVVSIITHFVS